MANRSPYYHDSKGLWIITIDHLSIGQYAGCSRSAVGRKSMAVTDENQDRCTIPFRLYDDDNVLYYTGMIAPETIEGDESLAFEPLDWASAYAGATRLDYLKDGEWETL